MSNIITSNKQSKQIESKPPFTHYFKGDTKKKYKFVYHKKYQLHINENNNEIYFMVEYAPYKNNKPTYKFFKISFDDIDYFNKNILSNDNKINEILIANKPIKPFLDLEKKFIEPLTIEQQEKILFKFITFYKDIFNKYFNVKILDNDIIILNSCGLTNEGLYKFSYHIIINNNVVFNNMKEQQIFIKFLYNSIKQNGNKDLYIIDQNAYKNDNGLRMINQTKFLDPTRILINNDISISDTYIIKYVVDDKTTFLNIDKLKNDIYNINKKSKNTNNYLKEPDVFYNDDDKQRINELLNIINSDWIDDYNEFIN
jgi:hypothetical protein